MAAAKRSTAVGKTLRMATHGRMAESHGKPLREDKCRNDAGKFLKKFLELA